MRNYLFAMSNASSASSRKRKDIEFSVSRRARQRRARHFRCHAVMQHIHPGQGQHLPVSSKMLFASAQACAPFSGSHDSRTLTRPFRPRSSQKEFEHFINGNDGNGGAHHK
jgi:hypothetical protein